MSWGDAFDLERILEDACDALDFLLGGENKVETAGHREEPGVDLRSLLKNFFDTRVGAADDNRETFGRTDSKRNLVHLQRPRPLRASGENEETRKDLGRLGDDLKLS